MSSDVKVLVKEYLYGSIFDSRGKAVDHVNVSNLVEIIFSDLIENGSRDDDGNLLINIGNYCGVLKDVTKELTK